MFVFGRLLKSWVSVLVMVLLSGCSSFSLVKTYDGPQVDPSRSAILSVSDGIEVLAVNGKEVKKYMIPELDLDYQILPGVNTVTFTHETLWARPGKKESGESNSELVVTAPMEVNFNAKAGEVYHFKFDSPGSLAEAKSNASSFKATLLDSSDRFVTESQLYVDAANNAESPSVVAGVAVGQTEAGANTAALAGATATVAASSAAALASTPTAMNSASVPASVSQSGALPTIDALKVLWDGASTEEKKEFLKWAFK